MLANGIKKLLGNWDIAGAKKYTSNAVWALVARSINLLLSTIVTIFLVRYLGPEHYGNLSYAVSFIGLFSVIASLGIDTILYRDLVAYPDKQPEYLGSALAIKLMAGTATAGAAILSALLFAHEGVSRLIIFMLAFTFIFNAFNIISIEFQAKVAQKYVSIILLSTAAILNILKIVVIFTNQGILYIGAIMLLEAMLYACFYLIFRSKLYGTIRSWRFNPTIARSLLNDSWPFIFIYTLGAVYTRIDQVMLQHFMDSTAVGLYDAAVRIAEMWGFIPSIIIASLFPAIINAHRTCVREFKKRLLYLALFILILCLTIIIPILTFAETIIRLIYGPAFVTAASVLTIYAFGTLFLMVSEVPRQLLIIKNRRWTIFLLTLSTALLNIILNYYLIPRYGINGAAWATLFSYSILLLPFVSLFRIKSNDAIPTPLYETRE